MLDSETRSFLGPIVTVVTIITIFITIIIFAIILCPEDPEPSIHRGFNENSKRHSSGSLQDPGNLNLILSEHQTRTLWVVPSESISKLWAPLVVDFLTAPNV